MSGPQRARNWFDYVRFVGSVFTKEVNISLDPSITYALARETKVGVLSGSKTVGLPGMFEGGFWGDIYTPQLNTLRPKNPAPGTLPTANNLGEGY